MDMAHFTYTRTNLNQEILCERDLTVVMSKHKILCHDRPKSKKNQVVIASLPNARQKV